MTFKAAAVQICSGVDPAGNAETMAKLVREAASRGATYVQTPEMTERSSATGRVCGRC